MLRAEQWMERGGEAVLVPTPLPLFSLLLPPAQLLQQSPTGSNNHHPSTPLVPPPLLPDYSIAATPQLKHHP